MTDYGAASGCCCGPPVTCTTTSDCREPQTWAPCCLTPVELVGAFDWQKAEDEGNCYAGDDEPVPYNLISYNMDFVSPEGYFTTGYYAYSVNQDYEDPYEGQFENYGNYGVRPIYGWSGSMPTSFSGSAAIQVYRKDYIPGSQCSIPADRKCNSIGWAGSGVFQTAAGWLQYRSSAGGIFGPPWLSQCEEASLNRFQVMLNAGSVDTNNTNLEALLPCGLPEYNYLGIQYGVLRNRSYMDGSCNCYEEESTHPQCGPSTDECGNGCECYHFSDPAKYPCGATCVPQAAVHGVLLGEAQEIELRGGCCTGGDFPDGTCSVRITNMAVYHIVGTNRFRKYMTWSSYGLMNAAEDGCFYELDRSGSLTCSNTGQSYSYYQGSAPSSMYSHRVEVYPADCGCDESSCAHWDMQVAAKVGQCNICGDGSANSSGGGICYPCDSSSCGEPHWAAANKFGGDGNGCRSMSIGPG